MKFFPKLLCVVFFLASAISASGYDNMSLPLMLEMRPAATRSGSTLIPVNITDPVAGSRSISLTADSLISLAAKPDLMLSYPRKLTLCLDMLREDTGVDLLHQADTSLPSLTGEGVVIGIIDKSIQPDHAAFLDADGLPSRIARLYHTVSGAESESRELEYTLYSTPQEILASPVESYSDGHGTHTASIAAGSCSYASLQGVAPGAELVLVSCGTSIYDDEIAFGMRAVAEYAQSVGKRCVISLSLSGETGAHDGTGFINSISDELAARGVIICFSSGNSGFAKRAIHSDGERISTVFEQLYNRAPTPRFEADVWSRDDSKLRIRFHVIDKNYKEITRTDWFTPQINAEDVDVLFGVSYKDEGVFSSLSSYFRGDLYSQARIDPLNGRYCLSFFYADPDDQFNKATWLLEPEDYALGISIEGDGKEVPFDLITDHATILEARLQPDFIDGSPFQSVNDFITTESVIGVGSYNLRESWPTLTGDMLSIRPDLDGEPGFPAIYSSFGENPAGDVIPHVLAPGTSIIAAYNGNCRSMVSEYTHGTELFGRKHYWGAMTGTSMATPATAGVIATWLQAAPEASLEDIVKALDKTSRRDSQFLSQPYKARFGKIDARAGALYLANLSSVDAVVATPELEVTQIGSEIEASCSKAAVFTLFLPSGEVLASTGTPSHTALINAGSYRGLAILTAATSDGLTTKKILIR